MKYIYVIFLFLLCACSRSSRMEDGLCKASVEVDFSAEEDCLPLSAFVSSKRIIHLDLPEGEVIGRSVQVCTTDSCLFVYDQLQISIYRFTKSGAFLNKIYRRGQGPGEYSTVTRLMVDGRSESLYVYDKIKGVIHVYTFSGDFLRTIQTEYMANNIALLPDGGFLCFTPDFIYNGPCGLWRMSADGKWCKVLLEYKEKYPVVSAYWDRLYPVSSQVIGISCPATDRYLHYDCRADSVSMELQVNPLQKSTRSFAGVENSMDVSSPYWACLIYACSSRFIFGIWTEQQGDPRAVYSLYDKRTGMMTCYKKLDTSSVGMDNLGHPVSADILGCLVTYSVDEADDDALSLCVYRLK